VLLDAIAREVTSNSIQSHLDASSAEETVASQLQTNAVLLPRVSVDVRAPARNLSRRLALSLVAAGSVTP
jgi:hypothetical protein